MPSYSFLNIRFLLIGSEYDSWSINNTLQLKCLAPGKTEFTLARCSQDQLKYIESYRAYLEWFMETYEQSTKKNAWTIGCSQHRYSDQNKYFNSDSERVPATTGPTIKDAISAFLKGARVVQRETQPWPSNTGCA
jgi:hypothetical protein